MRFIDLHTHRASKDAAVFSIVNIDTPSRNYPQAFSIGLHPWFLNEKTVAQQLLLMEKMLLHADCIAVGECGLDKVTTTAFSLQKEVFIKQILLAEKHQKPVIIHCVKAFQEIIGIKKVYQPKQVWLVHGFRKNLPVAQSLLKNGILCFIIWLYGIG